MSDRRGMKPRFTPSFVQSPSRESEEPCVFLAFDSIAVEQLRCELAAERAISAALRARLEVTARLLEAERAASE